MLKKSLLLFYHATDANINKGTVFEVGTNVRKSCSFMTVTDSVKQMP